MFPGHASKGRAGAVHLASRQKVGHKRNGPPALRHSSSPTTIRTCLLPGSSQLALAVAAMQRPSLYAALCRRLQRARAAWQPDPHRR